MAYTTDAAALLTKTVGKFVTLNRHQLAGHLANLDFWVGEVQRTTEAIDGYPTRFQAMQEAQQSHILKHDTRRFDEYQRKRMERLNDEFGDESTLYQAKPDGHRIERDVLRLTRQNLLDAFDRFIRRCVKENLLSADEAIQALARCDIDHTQTYS